MVISPEPVTLEVVSIVLVPLKFILPVLSFLISLAKVFVPAVVVVPAFTMSLEPLSSAAFTITFVKFAVAFWAL